MTNWLEPGEVERWLAGKRDGSWHGHPWKVQALEQFVWALAAEEPDLHEASCAIPDHECACLFGVARLLVAALDGGEK